jgi:hypothetical protein
MMRSTTVNSLRADSDRGRNRPTRTLPCVCEAGRHFSKSLMLVEHQTSNPLMRSIEAGLKSKACVKNSPRPTSMLRSP